MTIRTYAQAIAYAEGQHRNPSSYIRATRHCQQFARSCFNAAAFGSTALVAWNNIPDRHKGTGTPPPGSIAYWDDPRRSGEAGHAAPVFENGNIWSTDILHSGRVDKVHYTKISAAWGMRYLGYITWTPSGALPIMASITPKKVVHVSRVQPGKTGPEVLILQKWLKAEPKISLDYSSGPGVMGPRTKAAYAEWQKSLGFNRGDADGAPGITSLAHLAERHHGIAAP
jgi:hypothetical protein